VRTWHRAAILKWRNAWWMAAASFARSLRISKGDCAIANLVHPLRGERPIRRLQHLISSEKTDLIVHRVAKESELTGSADGSMAKGREPLYSTTQGPPRRLLTECAFSWKFANVSRHVWSVLGQLH
jgi:hypothetical protein